MRIFLQIVGIIILIPLVCYITLRVDNQDADGPSILFPGGELVAGAMYAGPDPDWTFTDEVSTIELQLVNPLSSRTIWIMESEGKVYIPSGYMRSFLGRLWKKWAFQADEGDGLAVARIDGVRYERQLIRIKDSIIIKGVAKKLAEKYVGDTSEQTIAAIQSAVASDDTYIFEMAPRSGGGS